MSNEPARFASAIFVGVVVALSPMIAFSGAARAADSCLSEPNGATPPGKHWYYRIEHGSGRHCWYLRGEDEKPASTGASESAPPSEAARSIADAHAELPQPARNDETAAAAPAAPADARDTAPVVAAAPLQVTAPWPAPSSLAQGGQGAVAASEERADPQATPAGEPAVAQPAQAVERNIGSLQKLMLVAFGALALAGLTGSAVYRSAAATRRRARRKDRWPKKTPPKAVSRAVSRTTSKAPRRPAPELADDMHLPPRTAPDLDNRIIPSAGDESEYPNDRVEKIEDFLARLTKQLQAEMENSRAAR